MGNKIIDYCPICEGECKGDEELNDNPKFIQIACKWPGKNMDEAVTTTCSDGMACAECYKAQGVLPLTLDLNQIREIELGLGLEQWERYIDKLWFAIKGEKLPFDPGEPFFSIGNIISLLGEANAHVRAVALQEVKGG